MNDIGKRIRELRLKRDMTQEQLAAALNLSAQAVSKWENGVTLPDIQLLPDLAVLFGITIDGLFYHSEDARFAMIDNMLAFKDDLSRQDYESAEGYLLDKLHDTKYEARALTQLGALYNHMAAGFHRKAELSLKRALEMEPEKKANHSLLCEAFGGVVWDFCLTNHHAQIAYYKQFTREHPDYHMGYLWLLENLLADRRFEEATQAVEKMRQAKDSYHAALYLGLIAALNHNLSQAEQIWEQMLEGDPENWLVHCALGDAYARLSLYEKAIPYYQAALTLEAPPRYTDNALSLAQLYEIQQDFASAANYYDKAIDILKDDHQITEGDTVAGYQAYGAKLRRKS